MPEYNTWINECLNQTNNKLLPLLGWTANGAAPSMITGIHSKWTR